MPFYDAGDAAIYYETTGTGRPLILLHGYAVNSLMWEYQRPVLEKKFQIILVDLRSFGKSSCGRRWSGGIMAEDVAGIIKLLDLHNVAILGFSMSGPVAFRVGLNNSEQVTALIFAASIFPSAGRPQTANQIKLLNEEIEILAQKGVDGWAMKAGLRTGPLVENMFKQNPEIGQLWDQILARHNPDYLRAMLAERARVVAKTNWRERLNELAQPTMIIAGAQDTRFVDASRYLHRTIARSQLKIISGAGHMVNLEKPEEFNRAVIDFLG